ncbi:MAG TPA: iron-containing alcohol dehydrogenase [bacterium]|mgnify:CR=1 FL=1|nr:iron-containing alcohol dehydrogenase [bacterium]
MNTFSFWQPTRIIFERGCLERELGRVADLGSSALVVTGRRFASATGLVDRVRKSLEKAGVSCTVFDRVKPEPDVENVEEGAGVCQREGCRVIIGVGGGSALDAGKAIAVLATNGGCLRDYFGRENFAREPLPVVAIPTTCGTGSEVTRYAVIVDTLAETKKTISSESLIPELALLDSELLKTLPPKLVAATAMDAFSHAVESFLSRRANILSQSFSRMALTALLQGLPEAVTAKEPAEYRELVFFGSLLAGLAINQTGTIMVHGMGYALTIRYGLHHGTANALLLPEVLEYLRRHGQAEQVAELERMWNGQKGLKKLLAVMGLPLRLSEVGVSASELTELARLAIIGCQRAVKNMSLEPSREDYRQILKALF